MRMPLASKKVKAYFFGLVNGGFIAFFTFFPPRNLALGRRREVMDVDSSSPSLLSSPLFLFLQDVFLGTETRLRKSKQELDN